jgi:hypothetical protein
MFVFWTMERGECYLQVGATALRGELHESVAALRAGAARVGGCLASRATLAILAPVLVRLFFP